GLSSSTRDLMRRGNFGSTWPTLLAPIRITRRKRIELALEAASRLRPNYPGLRLVISGPLGPHNLDNQAYRTKLRALRSDLNLEQSVCFLHELSGPNGIHPVDDQIISELYRLADCILLPSESEGFGLPVLEAALTRTPMVAADLQILRELAKEEIFYFPTEGGASAVVEAVENALSSNPSNLRRHIINQYAWPAVLQKMIAAIQQKFTNHASTKQG
ncbi:MAG: glycosyltransferase family 4 protein, partial [Candidatus Dormibacteraceae bacterium]